MRYGRNVVKTPVRAREEGADGARVRPSRLGRGGGAMVAFVMAVIGGALDALAPRDLPPGHTRAIWELDENWVLLLT